MKFWLDEYDTRDENEFSSIPFWSLNGTLEKEELQYQIKEMHDKHIGGYFMHARTGLTTEYLSDDWFDAMRACLDAGEKYGMKSYAYDENGWPSGFADGRVTDKGEKYWLKYVKKVNCSNCEPFPDNTLAAYVLTENGYEIISEPRDEYYTIVRCFNRYYSDTMNREVMADFINETHECYKKELGGDYLKKLKGFFTDEIQYGGVLGMPYSDIMPEEWKKAYGTELFDSLPMLYENSPETPAFKYRYYSLANKLISEAFMKQCYDWCEENGMEITGHLAGEDSLGMQVKFVGGAMPFYEYMHMPGVDWLYRRPGETLIPHQVASASAQLGRKRVLTETFCGLGSDISFADLKFFAQWQYVNGVNVMCQHLQPYTMEGARKRDYPPALFVQMPWWNKYKSFNDYFLALGKLLGDSEIQTDVVMIHPLKSAYMLYMGTEEFDRRFKKEFRLLENNHIEFHFGDETLIAKYGSVDKDTFIIGKCSYKKVVLPSLITLDSTTVKLLTEFAENGGEIYSLGELPTRIDGEVSSEINELLKLIKPVTNPREDMNCNDISICDDEGREIPYIRYTKRVWKGRDIYYICSLSQNDEGYANISFASGKKFHKIQLDTLSNKPFSKRIYFERGMDLVLEEGEIEAPPEVGCDEIFAEDVAEITLNNPNAITLDKCRYSVDGGEMLPEAPVCFIQEDLLKTRTRHSVVMEFSFDVQTVPQGEIKLVIERPEKFEILVNGEKISNNPDGYYVDKALKTISISGRLIQGINTVTLKTEFRQRPKVYEVLFGEDVYETELNKLVYDTELENIFIIGDFGVYSRDEFEKGYRNCLFTGRDFYIGETPKRVDLRELTQNGLLFYSGSVSFNREYVAAADGYLKLKFRNKRCVLMTAEANGEVRDILWEPFETVLPVHKGSNNIKITIYSGLRNLLGPHHSGFGEPRYSRPGSFAREHYGATSDKVLPRFDKYWNDDYTFLSFGINQNKEETLYEEHGFGEG